jgi:hypothetical protein
LKTDHTKLADHAKITKLARKRFGKHTDMADSSIPLPIMLPTAARVDCRQMRNGAWAFVYEENFPKSMNVDLTLALLREMLKVNKRWKITSPGKGAIRITANGVSREEVAAAMIGEFGIWAPKALTQIAGTIGK